MSGRRFNAAGAPIGGIKRGKAPLRGRDWVDSKAALEYAEATAPESAVLPAKKPKRVANEKSPETVAAKLVADASVCAITQLARSWPELAYPLLRSITLHAFYLEFAAAYGMRVPATELVLAPYTGAGIAAFLDVIRALPLATLTPEHFGAAHETLTGYGLADGKVVATDGRRGGGVHFTPRSLTQPIVEKTLEPLLCIVPPERTLELRVCDPAVGAGAFLLELVRQLGERVLGAGLAGDIHEAKRLVAIHCAYGVDICRYGVTAAKLALTLECRADAMEKDWLSGNIKHGDSIVGLSVEQISAFSWPKTDKKTGKRTLPPADPVLAALVDRAMAEGVAARKARMAELTGMARGAA